MYDCGDPSDAVHIRNPRKYYSSRNDNNNSNNTKSNNGNFRFDDRPLIYSLSSGQQFKFDFRNLYSTQHKMRMENFRELGGD
jgi:hypothetical protein